MPGTYRAFPYGRLPPVPAEALRGDFGYLRRGHALPEAGPSRSSSGDEGLAGIGPGAAALARRAVGRRAPRQRVRSCTDCSFNWPKRIAQAPGGEGGTCCFYSDSQGCLHWYLYLTPRRYHGVVASGSTQRGAGGEGGLRGGGRGAGRDVVLRPSLDEFVYRTWIENEIWFAL